MLADTHKDTFMYPEFTNPPAETYGRQTQKPLFPAVLSMFPDFSGRVYGVQKSLIAGQLSG